MGGHSGAECERLRRERQPLLAQVATLTHRAEVAERSCEDAKRREQEASAKMQAMAQSESNKALRHRAEAAEAECDRLQADDHVHRALSDDRLYREACKAGFRFQQQAAKFHRRAQEAERLVRVAMSVGKSAVEGMRESIRGLRIDADLWHERYRAAAEQLVAGGVPDHSSDGDQRTRTRRLDVLIDRALAERDEALASASLWRERCNAAEARTLYAGRSAEEWYVAAQQADARVEASEQSRSLCIEALRGVQATGDVDAQTWDVVADGIRALRERCTAAEERAGTWMWQRTEVLHSLRRARFLAAGWRRLARHYQSCHLAGHACLRETHRAKGEQVAALRRARDDDAAYRSDLMEQCDALRAKLARAEGVVEAAHHITRCHDMSCTGSPCTCGLDTLISALATYEEG